MEAKKDNKLSLKKNMVVFGVGVLLTKLLNFFFSPLFSKFLTTENFGVIDIISTTVFLLIPILTLAITEAVIKYGIDDKHDMKSVFSTGVLVSFFGLVLIVLFVTITGQFIYQEYVVPVMLYYMGECIFLLMQAFARAKRDTFAYVLSSVFYSVFSIGMIVILMVVKGYGVSGYFYGLASGTLIASLFIFFKCRTYDCFSFKSINKSTIRMMIKYSAPLVISNISYWVISGSDKYITDIVMGDTYTGYLAVIHKIPSICTLLYSIFNYAYVLSALKDYQLDGKANEEDTRFYSSLFRYITILLSIGVFIVCLFSQVITMLYDVQYHPIWIYIPLYTFGVVLGSLRDFYTPIYCVKEKTWKIMLIVSTGAIINAVTCFLLMKFTTIGLWATAISTILANGFILAFYYLDSQKYVKISLDIRSIISILMGLVISLLPLFIENLIVYYCLSSSVFLIIIFINLNRLIEITKKMIPKTLLTKLKNKGKKI